MKRKQLFRFLMVVFTAVLLPSNVRAEVQPTKYGSVTITNGESYRLVNPNSYIVSYSTCKFKSCEWTSSSSSVKITSQNLYGCTITGISSCSDVKVNCKFIYTNDNNMWGDIIMEGYYSVTVLDGPVPVKDIKLNYHSATLSLPDNKTITLKATITPNNATIKNILWRSTKESVATVDKKEDGVTAVVSAISAGETVIECYSIDGSTFVAAQCIVTVKGSTPIPVEEIKLNYTSLNMEKDETKSLIATVLPSNATNKSVTWSSNNNTVATVSNDGLVTAKDSGKATITCKANDGSGKQASCEITVSSPLVAEINATNFPDENFRKFLLSTSYGEDGQLTESEIKNVTSIDVSGSYSEPGTISSLKGIEYFTALGYLDCDYNQLTSLDVSKNTALTKLYCDNNQLTALDVSKNTALTNLSCSNNQLTALDVSKNTALTYLDCYYNQLTALDVSKNTALRKLWCYYNQLTALDVSKNTALINLSCDNNQLTALDVSKNTALTNLSCSNNQLTALDVSKNTELRYFYCTDNQLTELDVSKNTELTWLYCYNNQLNALDVSKNTELVLFACNNNRLTALDVSKNTALTSLSCGNNQLTALDVSKNTALRKLWCSNNQLSTLDVSKNTALEDLDCGYNQLTALDVSKNTELIDLYCSNNQLTALDVSKNTALTSLSCGNNQLTALDVSKNTKLTTLSCDGNQIKEAAMDNLIKSLPVNQTGKEYPFTVVRTDREEGNVCTELQVATAKAKGWTPKAYNGSKWVEYEGGVIDDINQVTIGSALVAGYSGNRSLDFTSLQDKGVSAWIATGFRNGNVLLSRVYAIPAGEGVYVKAEKAGTYEIPVSTEDPYYMNMFVGVPYGKTVNMYEEYYGEQFLTLSLALSKTTGKPGFFPNTEAKTYGKNKMYLHMPARMLPEYAKTRMNDFLLGIEFEEEEATGISDASHLNEKGQMINDKRGEVYDLQGRKVNAYGTMHRSAEGRLLPTGRKNAQLPKGMYIMNGKKVVVK